MHDLRRHEFGDRRMQIGAVQERVRRAELPGDRIAERQFAGDLAGIPLAADRELRLERGVDQPLGEVTLSLGVATFPDHGTDRENLLYAADTALYEAKRGGRNRVVLSSTRPPPREAPRRQPG